LDEPSQGRTVAVMLRHTKAGDIGASRADLSDARNLTREQLDKAIIDETTILAVCLRS
jgi:hypothetical protein